MPPAPAPAADTTTSPSTGRLNTEDVKYALGYLVTRGDPARPAAASDFAWIPNTKDYLTSFVQGNEYYEYCRTSGPVQCVTGTVRSFLDYNKDGKVTSEDWLALYQAQIRTLDNNRESLNYYLPFAGQCAFGMACGWAVGRFANRMYRNKVTLALVGACGYLAFQYAAESQVINKAIIQQQLEERVRSTLDVNKDGKIDREDVEGLIGDKLTIVKDKLGPQVFAPGMVGVATFALGLLRGIRIF